MSLEILYLLSRTSVVCLASESRAEVSASWWVSDQLWNIDSTDVAVCALIFVTDL